MLRRHNALDGFAEPIVGARKEWKDLIPREADKTELKCKELRINEEACRMTSGMRSAGVLCCFRCLHFCGLPTPSSLI